MANAREDKNENIRISPFILEGESMIDIRFWKSTKAGPKPTARGIAIKRSMIIRMIIALQKMNVELNIEEANVAMMRGE